MTLPWQDYELWKEYGRESGYNQRCVTELATSNSDDERCWYNKGRRSNWLKLFKFKGRLSRRSPFKSFKQWREYGLSNDYNNLNPSNLSKSSNYNEKSWYGKGGREKWLRKFKFKRKIIRCEDLKLEFKNYSQWKNYGIERNYNSFSIGEIMNDKGIKARLWYRRGQRRGWTLKSKFRTIMSNLKFDNEAEWKRYGLKRGYDGRTSNSLIQSGERSEKSWYLFGYRRKWAIDFPFQGKRRILTFDNEAEWKRYGLEKGYDKRDSMSLVGSGDKKERSWYGKGQREGWSKEFPLMRKRGIKINSQEKLEQFIKENPEAEAISRITTANGYIADAADIFVKLWPERFTSASKLALSLPGAVKGIGHSLKPFSFGKVRRLRERTRSLPQSIRYQLDDILSSIACDQYQTKFNKDPEKTINELEKFVKQNEETRPVTLRVLEYYNNIYNFDVPGYGNLK